MPYSKHLLSNLAKRRYRVYKQSAMQPDDNDTLLHLWFEQTHTINLLIDPVTLHIVKANAAACDFYGYTADQFIGMSLTELTQRDEDHLRSLMQQPLPSSRLIHSHHLRSTGESRDVEFVLGQLQSGQTQYWYAVSRDITERKRLEEALRASEQRLRLITDNMADLVILTDGKRRAAFVSPSFKTVLGYDLETIENGNILEYIHPNDIERILTTIFTARSSGQPGFATEFMLRHADGHYIDAEAVGKFTYNQQGDFLGTVLITRDVTERKHLLESILEREKLQTSLQKEAELSNLKSRMMERITHEFRTPLAIIQIASENLTQYYERLRPEKRAEKMETIKAQIQRITIMLDEIALVVNGSFTPDYLTRVRTNLSALCRDIALHLTKSSNLPDKFVLTMPESLFLWADPRVLDSALTHIIRNALRFSEPDSPVQVTLTRIDHAAQLVVVDQGIGILPEEHERIFEPFFRGSNINERAGIGLGLTIARAAIEAHGGSIHIKSDVHQGTAVTITLPT